MEKEKELEKIKIEDYRCLILDKEGTWYKYSKQIGVMHQDCIDHFAKEKNYSTNRMDDIAMAGNFIFLVVNNEMLALKSPNNINDEQSMKLDFFSFSMNSITYLEIEKIKEDGEKEKFMYMDNVKENFTNDFLQSFYKKGKIR